ncbi:hypothetical protein PanWU01x14_354350 [Parasponia andersonii]|uniref:Uncharacterized protein n=1 Tax=Parasponia andersonii TaxID=3476 RepID=A0A2P5A9P4_PARAD|nr:hypothetical protein PanWU01x14_354350 [Parasponia andersonii]
MKRTSQYQIAREETSLRRPVSRRTVAEISSAPARLALAAACYSGDGASFLSGGELQQWPEGERRWLAVTGLRGDFEGEDGETQGFMGNFCNCSATC